MVRLIRQYQPRATIILGGHIANLENIQIESGADHVVKGDGIRWMRNYLGENPEAAIEHPLVESGLWFAFVWHSLK